MTAPEAPFPDLELPVEVSRAASLLAERKAADVSLLDLRGISTAADFFLVASGRSDVHVTAISEHLVEGMKRVGAQPAGVEGLGGGRWVLIDFFDLVVHVFHPATREFYQLETLWGDAPLHRLAGNSPASDG
ncbi:MAG: ribosome silencing factor [Longimicrobiaceae bacterium]